MFIVYRLHRVHHVRLFSTTIIDSKFISPVQQPLVELREYVLHPGQALQWATAINDTISLRLRNLPLRSFTLPESGGQLHQGTHTYYYAGGYEERDIRRAEQLKIPEWRESLSQMRNMVAQQRSTLWVEAPLVKGFGLHSLETAENPGKGDELRDGPTRVIYELRKYQLKLGYSTVPTFLDNYAKGLPSKLLATGSDPTTSLITVMYNETGNLNEVIEIWRHGDGTAAMERSRQASRSATSWRIAIGNIAELAISFNSTIHKPIPGTPWQ